MRIVTVVLPLARGAPGAHRLCQPGGAKGNGAVGPDETMVFVIDAVTVTG